MRFPWFAALCLFGACPLGARPYTIDDMLRVESYGNVRIDPGGSWAVIERRDRYDSARRYTYNGSPSGCSRSCSGRI
jgi:hypothetical protein